MNALWQDMRYGARSFTLVAAPLPFHDNQITLPTTFSIVGRSAVGGEAPTAYRVGVTPGYLAALGLPLLRGRALTAFDDADSPPIALINRDSGSASLGTGGSGRKTYHLRVVRPSRRGRA